MSTPAPKNSSTRKVTPSRRLVRVLVVCLALYLAAGILVTIFQRQLLYHPTKIGTKILQVMAKSDGFEPWRNRTGEIIGWKSASPVVPAQGQVLIAHGNAGCAIDRSDYAKALRGVSAFDVFILEYPGYGDRSGSPSQSSLLQSADEALQLLGTNAPVYVIGESLGTGVATYLASAHPAQISGLLLFAPYNALTSVAQHHMPIFPAR